ncbi:transcription termination/antitermination NusG family protein [Pseudomonas viridiflava]
MTTNSYLGALFFGAFVAGCAQLGTAMMKSWFLTMHCLKGKHLEVVVRRLADLGVEAYLPTSVSMKKRLDCSSFRIVEKQMFPGYMFLRFDPEQVHTTTISDFRGMKGFVRFGTTLAQPSNTLIEALKQSLLLRMDKNVNCIEFRNLPEDVQASLVEIAAITSTLNREIALLKLLQKLSHTEPATMPHSMIERI